MPQLGRMAARELIPMTPAVLIRRSYYIGGIGNVALLLLGRMHCRNQYLRNDQWQR